MFFRPALTPSQVDHVNLYASVRSGLPLRLLRILASLSRLRVLASLSLLRVLAALDRLRVLAALDRLRVLASLAGSALVRLRDIPADIRHVGRLHLALRRHGARVLLPAGRRIQVRSLLPDALLSLLRLFRRLLCRGSLGSCQLLSRKHDGLASRNLPRRAVCRGLRNVVESCVVGHF